MKNKPTTNPQRRAAIALLRLGHASLSEVADLAGVPRQNVHMWTKLDGMTDWQSRRKAWLEREWVKRTKPESGTGAA